MPYRSHRRSLATALVAVVALSITLGIPAARAGGSGERIVEYDIDIAIGVDGGVRFEERIVYDFGRAERHGLFREIVTRQTYDDRYDRVYPFELEGVEGSADTPVDVQVHRSGSVTKLQIGDPDRTITGRHTYVIRYRLDRVLNGFTSHDELYWNAIGLGWDVPIDVARIAVAAPAAILEAACFAGPRGSTRACANTSVDGQRATFTHEAIGPNEAVAPVVAIPTGVVPTPEPLLDERPTITSTLGITPLKVASALILGLALTMAVGWFVWTRGRDEQHAGHAISAALDGSGPAERVPLGGGGVETPVEFEPPDGLRPGQVGTLVDEVAHPLDVSATIVDLAVRGYLRIEEVDGKGWFAKDGWRLVLLREPDAPLLAYERKLLTSLFAGSGGTVLIADLREEFHKDLAAVQDLLYADAVSRGWFPTRPDRIRQRVAGLGAVVAVAGFAATLFAFVSSSWGLLVTPLPWLGIVLVVGARFVPRRTPAGTATVRRVLGFRRFITESEAERAQFAERAHLFTEYLPYAVVFGATEQWARAFEGLADEPSDWYVGRRGLTPLYLADTLSDFSVRTAGSLAATPGGSGGSGFGGGGFSGGGGGGGGGGSW